MALPLTADCIDIMLRRMRDIETIDSERLLVVAFRRQARERGGPLPSIVSSWRMRCWMNGESC